MTRSTAAGAGADGGRRSEIDLALSKTGTGVVAYVTVVAGRAVVGDDGEDDDNDDDDDAMIDGLYGDGVVDVVNGRLFGWKGERDENKICARISLFVTLVDIVRLTNECVRYEI